MSQALSWVLEIQWGQERAARRGGCDPPSERMFFCFPQTARVKVNSLYPSDVELVQSGLSGFVRTSPFPADSHSWEGSWVCVWGGSPLKVWRPPSPSSLWWASLGRIKLESVLSCSLRTSKSANPLKGKRSLHCISHFGAFPRSLWTWLLKLCVPSGLQTPAVVPQPLASGAPGCCV